jgi:iron complex outermembrane receptor protein
MPSRRASLTLGARGDYNTRFGGTFNPRVGFVTRFTDRTTLKLLFGTAYLAPSPYQSYGHFGSFYSTDGGATYASDYWHVPNPDLKPQHKQTADVNLLHSLTPQIAVSASGFVSRFTNLIKDADPVELQRTYRGWPVAYIDFPVNEGKRWLRRRSVWTI